MSSMYAVYNGPKKIKHIAQTVNRQCNQLAESLLASGINLFTKNFLTQFDSNQKIIGSH